MIEGENIRLRPFGFEDIDFLLRLSNEPDCIGEFEPFEPLSRKQLEDWLPEEKLGELWYVI